MTYTETLESDNVKLIHQLQNMCNWVEQNFNPEFASENEFNEKGPKEIVEESEFILQQTNRIKISNQMEMFELEEKDLIIKEFDVLETLKKLSKRINSNAECIKSITKQSLLLNINACRAIMNELIVELETKRLSRNGDENNAIKIPAKE